MTQTPQSCEGGGDDGKENSATARSMQGRLLFQFLRQLNVPDDATASTEVPLQATQLILPRLLS